MKKVTYKIKLTLPETEGDLVKWSAYKDETFISQGEEVTAHWALDTAAEAIYNESDVM